MGPYADVRSAPTRVSLGVRSRVLAWDEAGSVASRSITDCLSGLGSM